jgi:hypothetical protein
MTCHVASVLIKFIPKIEVNRERGKKMNTRIDTLPIVSDC